MIRFRQHVIVFSLMAAVAIGCRHQYLDPRVFGQIRRDLPETRPDALQVRFLSVQGFVLRWRSVAIMTPPLYSNPPLGLVVKADAPLPNRPELIEQFLDPEWVKGVSAILVGHSHYDHLMDVPDIWREYVPGATVYGSRTATYLLEAKGIPRSNLVALNARGDDVVDYRSCQRAPAEGCVFQESSEGKWVSIAGGRARFRAICSRHSPQFLRLPVTSTGCLNCLPDHPPASANDWRLGDTFAYLIDFLDEDGTIAYRVYYQDSPTSPTFGYVPERLVPERRTDVALLCAGGFDQVDGNPDGILANTDPRHVLLGHWEHFFSPLSAPLTTIFVFDLNELKSRFEGARARPDGLGWKGDLWFPAPGQLFVFDRESS